MTDEELVSVTFAERNDYRQALEEIRDLGPGHPSYIIAMAVLNPNFPE